MSNSTKSSTSKSVNLNKPDEAWLDSQGLLGLIKLGMNTKDELKGKNRTILFLLVAMAASLSFNTAQYLYRPEPKLLGETSDGRIRPLPLLSEPLFSHEQIRDWSAKCVERIYKLSYVDWETSIQNNTFCLSDKAREGFVESLKQVGVFQYLNPKNQGRVRALADTPVLRSTRLTPTGYKEWLVDVPYRITVDGLERGNLDVVMTMRIRRVSLTWRPEGIWVEEYLVKQKTKGV